MNSAKGVELRISPGRNSGYNYQDKSIEDYFLSSECGRDFVNCQAFVLAADSASENSPTLAAQSFIAIVPLNESLAFQKLTRDDNKGFLSFSEEDPYIHDLRGVNCSPASPPYRVGYHHYMLCYNTDAEFVTLLTLKLNETHTEDIKVLDDEYLHVSSVRSVTNSLLVDLPEESDTVIFFATGYNIYYYKPLDGIVGELDIGLEENDFFVTAIDYIGGWEMIAYCNNDQAIYIDLNREFIFETVDYRSDGQPHVCPNPDVYLAVFAEAGYVQYAFRSTQQAKNFELFSDEFDNGICVGSIDTTLFVFTDRERGTQLLNASGNSIRSLSDTTCTNYPCQPLVLLEDQYLAIREKRGINWYISLFDTHNNFSLVLEAKHTRADFMAVIETTGVVMTTDSTDNHTETIEIIPDVEIDQNTPKPNYNSKDRGSNEIDDEFLATAVVSSFVVVITIFSIAALCYILYIRR